jgi:hypothetical protein
MSLSVRRLGPAVGRRPPGAGGGREQGGKEGGGRGLSTTVLTLARDGLGMCLRGKGRPAVEMRGGGAVELEEKGRELL